MDVKLWGGGREERVSSRLNKFKYRIVCIIMEFIEYFPRLFMFVNVIPFKRLRVLSFWLYLDDFKTVNNFGSFMAGGKYVM
jgi:hypothetical protein